MLSIGESTPVETNDSGVIFALIGVQGPRSYELGRGVSFQSVDASLLQLSVPRSANSWSSCVGSLTITLNGFSHKTLSLNTHNSSVPSIGGNVDFIRSTMFDCFLK